MAGGSGIVTLIPIDIALVVATISVTQVPVIGPVVDVLILLPTDLTVAYLHIPFAEMVVQGATRPCSDLNIKLFPPFEW